MTPAGPTFSIVVPAFNEEESLPELIGRLLELMDRLDGTTEVILVDDGSEDGTWGLLSEVCSRDPRFKALQLSRNFGHQSAITAGLDVASGDAVIVMDADLQDPPEVVLEMVERWRDGYEVVYAVRGRREGDSAFKRITASLFYRTLRRISDLEAPVEVGDFRLVDRKALDAFRLMRESNRYVRGMFGWIGFKQTGVTFSRAERFGGTTKYSLRKMVKFAMDALVGFSNVPLQVALRFGFILSALSVAGGIAALILKLTGALLIPGWASLIVAVSFLGGIQLCVLGVIGEYISRIHDEVKGRPLYLIRESRGFHAQTSAQNLEALGAVLPPRGEVRSPIGTSPPG
jgi:dolichol-phosphate mannosyltransferase